MTSLPPTSPPPFRNEVPVDRRSTALRTDHYELTMVDAARQSGRADDDATFELFTRRLPRGRAYGVVAGTEQAIDAVTRFRFSDTQIEYLGRRGVVSADTLAWLADYRFRGDIWGFAEGEVHFANEPVLTVRSSFAEAIVLETILLSIFNHDSAIAAAAARMVDAAAGRSIMEAGSRRTHDENAVASARAAYLVGAGGSSNLEAGYRYGVPTLGTTAHAFVLAHRTEREAFIAQREAFGPGSTYLVDTYDVVDGIRTAVEVCGTELGAIRIDSGDLAEQALGARALLDALGCVDTRIIVSNDLDEWRIAELASAPIDGYLAGTALVSGSGHPTAGFVYKLVAIDDGSGPRPVAKTSGGKIGQGGVKTVRRLLDADGHLERDLVTVGAGMAPEFGPGPGRGMQIPLVMGGEVIDEARLVDRRDTAARSRDELHDGARLPDPTHTYPVPEPAEVLA